MLSQKDSCYDVRAIPEQILLRRLRFFETFFVCSTAKLLKIFERTKICNNLSNLVIKSQKVKNPFQTVNFLQLKIKNYAHVQLLFLNKRKLLPYEVLLASLKFRMCSSDSDKISKRNQQNIPKKLAFVQKFLVGKFYFFYEK